MWNSLLILFPNLQMLFNTNCFSSKISSSWMSDSLRLYKFISNQTFGLNEVFSEAFVLAFDRQEGWKESTLVISRSSERNAFRFFSSLICLAARSMHFRISWINWSPNYLLHISSISEYLFVCLTKDSKLLFDKWVFFYANFDFSNFWKLELKISTFFFFRFFAILICRNLISNGRPSKAPKSYFYYNSHWPLCPRRSNSLFAIFWTHFLGRNY